MDGKLKQEGRPAQLIWSIADVIAIASRSMALAPGDLIVPGTPSGVGPSTPGQTVRGGVAGLGDVAVTVGVR